jgi:hypothetical protein
VNNTNALGSWASGAVTITNGGTLDIGGFSTAIPQANPDFSAKQFYLAGAGAIVTPQDYMDGPPTRN